MRLWRDETIQVKIPAQLALLREARLVTAATLRPAAVGVGQPEISAAEVAATVERCAAANVTAEARPALVRRQVASYGL